VGRDLQIRGAVNCVVFIFGPGGVWVGGCGEYVGSVYEREKVVQKSFRKREGKKGEAGDNMLRSRSHGSNRAKNGTTT